VALAAVFMAVLEVVCTEGLGAASTVAPLQTTRIPIEDLGVHV